MRQLPVLLGGLLALALLTGAGGSQASWVDATTTGGAALTSGTLALGEATTSVSLQAPGEPERPLDPADRLVPGDTVRVRTAVTLRVRGDLTATLELDTAALPSGPVVAVVDAEGVALPPAPGRSLAWQVGPQHDGYTAGAVLTLTLPTDQAGLPWGEDLQGAVVGPGLLRWRLAQDGPA